MLEKSSQLRKYLSDFGILYDFADLKTDDSERRSLWSLVNMERMKNNLASFDNEETNQIFELTREYYFL